MDEGGFDDDAKQKLKAIKRTQLGCGWISRKELKIRPRFQSNLPTGSASAVWLIAFGVHTGLACAVLGKLSRDSADEIYRLILRRITIDFDLFFRALKIRPLTQRSTLTKILGWELITASL